MNMAKTSALALYAQDVTRCSICLERFIDPRALHCLHTFCLRCLEKHCELKHPGDTEWCPICRTEFQIPEKGVEDLQKNFLVSGLMIKNVQNDTDAGDDDGDADCVRCGDEAGDDEPKSKHVRCRVRYCEQHTTNRLEFYCTECKVNICRLCSTVDHREHDCQEIHKFAEEFKQKMNDNIVFLSGLAADVKRKKQELEAIRRRLHDELGDIETSINQQSEECKSRIDKTFETFLHDMQKIKTEKEKEIGEMVERMDRRQIELDTFISNWWELRDMSSPCDITQAEADLSRRADELKASAAADNNGGFSTDTSSVQADMENVLTTFRALSALCGQLRGNTGKAPQNDLCASCSPEQNSADETQSSDAANDHSNNTTTLAEDTSRLPITVLETTATVNIAVIGNSGVGKSSFINAFLELELDVSAVEQQVAANRIGSIKVYSHPASPQLKLWDLPGAPQEDSLRALYLQDIVADRYDLFLLLSAATFAKDDAWLVHEVEKRAKQVYLVRTNVGVDAASIRGHASALEKLRKSLTDQLQLLQIDFKLPQIFLVDSNRMYEFDFAKLRRSLIVDIQPKAKQILLIASMSGFCEDRIRRKAMQLRSKVWQPAAVSGLLAVFKVPGVSLAVDACLLGIQSNFYLKEFGLDDNSINEQAETMNTSADALKEIVNKTFPTKTFTNPRGFLTLVRSCGLTPRAVLSVLAVTAEELVRLVPGIRVLLLGPLSYVGTRLMLNVIITRMESVALEVARYAVENPSHDNDETF